MSDPTPESPDTPTPATPAASLNLGDSQGKQEPNPSPETKKIDKPEPAAPINSAGATDMVNSAFSSHAGTGHNLNASGSTIGEVNAAIDQSHKDSHDTHYHYSRPSEPDPTIEYSAPTKVVELQKEEVDEMEAMAKILRDQRLLIVSCSEFEVLDTVIDALLQRPEFRGYEQRVYDEEFHKAPASFQTFFSREQSIGSGGESVIVLDVAEGSTLTSELKKQKRGLAEKVAKHLSPVKRRLIYRVQTASNEDYGEFAHWHFDFLRYVLPRFFPPAEASSIGETLLAQWTAGKWKILESENDFWGHIATILRGPKGPEVLRAEMHRLSNAAAVVSGGSGGANPMSGDTSYAEAGASGEPEGSEKVESTMHAGATLIPGTPLASPLLERDKLSMAVLFTGTFFPNLSLHEFERALSVVMDGDTIKATEPTGRLLRSRAAAPRKLADLWKQEGDTYLRDCQLQLWGSSNERRFMEFTVPVRPWLQWEYERALPRYTFERWSRVLSSGWLFEENISAQVLRDLLKIAMRATQLAPETYGKNLLFSVLRGLGEYVRSVQQQGQSELARKLDEDLQDGVRTTEDFRRLVELVFLSTEIFGGEARKKTRHIYRRLGQLCRAMLEEAKLAGTVSEFFQDLLAIKQFDPILSIGEQLRGVANFDYTMWLRRILDDSKASHIFLAEKSENRDERARLALVTRARIYDSLLRQMADSGEGAMEVLGTVRSWLPPSDKEPDQFSHSECYALTFPLRFCMATDRTEELWEKGTYATVPSSPQLDRWIDNGGSASSDVLAEIQNWGDWICHRGLGAAAKLHGLDSILGQIQKGQPNRNRVLANLREEATRHDLVSPDTDDLESWATFLRAMSAAANEEDLAAFQVAETLRRWALAVSPLTGEAPKNLAALLDQLLRAASASLKSRRSLLTKIERIWSDFLDQLLKLLGTIDASKENQRNRLQTKGIRAVTYRLRKAFQNARATGAEKASI